MSNSSKSGGIGIFGVIQIVLIILKLAKLVTWKWWAVLLPVEIQLGVYFLVILWAVIQVICEDIFGY